MCTSPDPLSPTASPSPSVVRALIGQLLPKEPDLRVEPVDEGGEHSTWWVGERYVLRLTLDEDAAVRQRREVALRAAIQAYVPVAVPVSVAAGDWAPGLACTVDSRLPGDSAERRPVGREGEHDLAGMLRGLRALPPGRASALGLPRQEPRALDALRRSAEEALARLAAYGEAPAAHVPPHGPAATARPAPAVVLHNDLKGEHLLVSSTGRVSGVLDWADAVVGDPAEDVAGLALSIGTPATERVAVAAGLAPEVFRRGVLLARCDTAIRLAHRLDGRDDSPLPLLRAQVERAWAG
ncbi:aminoglycoside phosphotransferase family protein [Streptomyces sp. NPDC127108]|uniref:aminoglycoside phosphotransferase family protein n=1 Tax=Streptomyces sp. NPDC127108 TaxID=3345361 RepID=UPI0036271362